MILLYEIVLDQKIEELIFFLTQGLYSFFFFIN